MTQVIGWDTRRQGLLVLRNDPQNPGRKQVELYRLPTQQSGAKQDA